MVSFILFIFILFLVFYIPGRYILRLCNFNQSSFLVIFSIAISLGICLFLVSMYTLSWIKLEYIYNLAIAAFFVLEIRHTIREFKQKISFKHVNFLEILVLAAGTYLMTSVMWTSGLVSSVGMNLFSINATDSIYHLSLIGNLVHNFPPTHPGLSDIPLRGYHFFYDLMLANFVKFYHFNSFDLYFRYFALFISLYFGISTLALCRFLKFNNVATISLLFSIYFAQSFRGFLFFLIGENAGIYDPGIVQALGNILDPNVIFSLSILFSFYIFVFSTQLKTIKTIIIAALILGLMPQIKIYTAFVAFFAFFVVSIVAVIKNKNFNYFKTFVLGSIIASLVYLPINFGAGSLIFAPFLLYKHFMESSRMFPSYEWPLKYDHYLEHNNYLRIIQLYVIALVLFFIPSLGIRIISILGITKMIKASFYTLENIFLTSIVVVSFLIPTLFIQNIAVFVVVQFFWIAYIILLIPTAVVLGNIFKSSSVFVSILVILVLGIINFSENHAFLKIYSANPHIVDSSLLSLSNDIKKIPQDKGILILNRNGLEDMYKSPFISALGQHPVYYEPEVGEFRGLDEVKQDRFATIAMVDNILQSCENTDKVNDEMLQFMRDTRNTYLVLLKENSCIEKLANFRKISQYGSYSLYKVL